MARTMDIERQKNRRKWHALLKLTSIFSIPCLNPKRQCPIQTMGTRANGNRHGWTHTGQQQHALLEGAAEEVSKWLTVFELKKETSATSRVYSASLGKEETVSTEGYKRSTEEEALKSTHYSQWQQQPQLGVQSVISKFVGLLWSHLAAPQCCSNLWVVATTYSLR